MKKIGILFGQENTFPWAFIDRINQKAVEGIVAEAVTIDKVIQGEPTEYAVIIDRISQDVPFYRAYLKNAALCGTAVINNPFWWSADEKFFNNALSTKVGVPVPKTVLLPSKARPDDTDANSFRNLQFLDWEGIFEYVGFPAFMKPYSGGGWKNVYKLDDQYDFFKSYDETGQLVMMLQEAIDFTSYFRCYYLNGDRVHIMPYEPRNPHHLRYIQEPQDNDPELLKTVEEYVIALNHALGYDFNTVEFAIRDGIPYAIDFCNPAPDADYQSVGAENFEWVVENAANMAIERALKQKEGANNLTWGSFMQNNIKDFTAMNVTVETQATEAVNQIISHIEEENTVEDSRDFISSHLPSKVLGYITEHYPDAKIEEVEIEEDGYEVELDNGLELEFDTEGNFLEAEQEEVEEEVEVEVEVNVEEEVSKEEESNESEAEGEESEDTKKAALMESLGTATEEEKEDLKKIKGVGPKLESVLNSIGIYTFAQVSKMTVHEYDLVDSLLTTFKGRAKRDQWAEQAKAILEG